MTADQARDRAHARLVGEALAAGLNPAAALRYADMEIDRLYGQALALQFAVNDMLANAHRAMTTWWTR